MTVIDRCLQDHSAKSDTRHMGGPALLSRLPSHESFVEEVEVAGAVRSTSEPQEEANILAVTLSHADSTPTLPMSLCVSVSCHLLPGRRELPFAPLCR